ncbi:hypothetical protein [Streptomyces sp. NPDC047070]|uniref:RNA polymerase sigma factor n=1 Tax=Streptomyces sp. NPDC047070 TaxID=3154923 RepID=UPI0034516790
MSDATPLNSPAIGNLFDTTDERLAAELKKGSGRAPARYPAGELLGRHWAPVFSYARLCTHGVQYAGMLATAAFTRLFGESVRQVGPRAAWRPELLITVRRTAGEWDTNKRREMLSPEVRSGPGDSDSAAVRLLPPNDRRLVSLAFQRLPEAARCVLWHAEVEAEELAVPARLLGLPVRDASPALERARELLRQYCLEAHRELAPDDECRRYSRLLDVSLRRGGNSVDPDLRQHMAVCEHCPHSAAQLDQSGDRLPVLLAEGVLGWGARPYLASRPGRRPGGEETTAGPVVSTTPGSYPDAGRHPGADFHSTGGWYPEAGSCPGAGGAGSGTGADTGAAAGAEAGAGEVAGESFTHDAGPLANGPGRSRDLGSASGPDQGPDQARGLGRGPGAGPYGGSLRRVRPAGRYRAWPGRRARLDPRPGLTPRPGLGLRPRTEPKARCRAEPGGGSLPWARPAGRCRAWPRW